MPQISFALFSLPVYTRELNNHLKDLKCLRVNKSGCYVVVYGWRIKNVLVWTEG